MVRPLEKLLKALYVLVLTILIVNVIITCVNENTLVVNDRWADHTREVLSALERTRSLLTDAETGQRGYLLTGERPYLDPYLRSAANMAPSVAHLATLTMDNPGQQARVARLSAAINEKFQELGQTIALREQNELERTLDIVRTGRGRQAMIEARQLIDAMKAVENGLLERRLAASRVAFLRTVATFALATALTLALLVIVGLLHRRDLTLRQQEEMVARRLAAIVESSDDAIIGKTLDGVITTWNAGAERIFGYTAAEVVGKPITVLSPEDRQHEEREFLAQLKRGEWIDHVGTVRVTKDGRRLDVSLTISPIKDETGQIVGSSKIARDITDLKRAEEELARRAEELARSNNDLERFAYVASHDLQEPLRMISSFNQLLARRYKGLLDEKADEYIGFTVDGCSRMQRLIEDLLSFARVNTRGRAFESVDCEALIDRTLIDLQATIEETGATVTHDALPTLPADRSQIGQLLLNLIANAIKFHSDQPPRIHVSAERIEHAWRFCVADNGIGIDSQYSDRIFEIFQRLHTRDEYPGTGIGLALCKKIVERHGGWIWFEANPGGGTRFCFTIPGRAAR